MAMQRDTLPACLLEDVKSYLDITWNDEATDQKIGNLIASGAAYLDGKCGGEADYIADGMPRTLLFEWVRYARDAALDVFENNYASMILAMQHERAVARYAESTISSEA